MDPAKDSRSVSHAIAASTISKASRVGIRFVDDIRTYRESLRDSESCLRSVGSKLYQMGFRSKIARSTLCDANPYALNSTTIPLCLSLFPWAKFRHSKAAAKMHTLRAAAARFSGVFKRCGVDPIQPSF